MSNRSQREFIEKLSRPQLNQLCLELQAMVTNFKLFLAETHGYTNDEVTQIMFGKKFEDISTASPKSSRHSANKDTNRGQQPTPPASDESINHELAGIKQEDELHRRALMFELEWCVAQIERGNFPY